MEEVRVLTSGKVHICLIFCRIPLIISTITVIVRDFFFFLPQLTLEKLSYLFVPVCCAKSIIFFVYHDINKFGEAL